MNIASLATIRAGPCRGAIEASKSDTEGCVFSSSIIITFVAPRSITDKREEIEIERMYYIRIKCCLKKKENLIEVRE